MRAGKETAPARGYTLRSNRRRVLKKTASRLRPGPERDYLLKKVQQIDTAMHINEWLSSPGLQRCSGMLGARANPLRAPPQLVLKLQSAAVRQFGLV